MTPLPLLSFLEKIIKYFKFLFLFGFLDVCLYSLCNVVKILIKTLVKTPKSLLNLALCMVVKVLSYNNQKPHAFSVFLMYRTLS
jgi:hypothetical protein